VRSIRAITTTALFLFFGIAAPAIAGQEKPKEESKPPKQEQQARPARQQPSQAPKQQQARPERQQQAQAPKQQNNSTRQQQQTTASKQQQSNPAAQQQHARGQQSQQNNSARQQQQANTSKQQQNNSARQQQQPRQQQARSSQAPQRTQQAIDRQRSQPALRLSARGSGRIPDDRFRSNFGRGHNFRIGNPVLVGGYSRFQYGGFWFGFVEPWPADWYYTDDVYIDYVDDGYYMYNPYYPGTRFSISVVI